MHGSDNVKFQKYSVCDNKMSVCIWGPSTYIRHAHPSTSSSGQWNI